MATAPSITLNTDILWEVALEFRTWNYRLKNTNTAPNLGPSYPGTFLQNLDGYLKARGATIFSSEQMAEYRAMETRPPGPSTNCCMFVEAVVIGAALRSHADRLEWTSQYHSWSMVAPTRTESAAEVVRFFGPVRAYVEAGLASMPESPDEPPGEWCVVQGFTDSGGGHTFLILKCEDGKCLTLEANCWNGDYQSGYVGHRGNGKTGPRRIADEIPADWKQFAPTWKQITDHYKRGFRFARLNVERPLKFTCPLDAGGLRSGAWRNYHNNESAATGKGGYFVPGLYRNLHGGVHLFPPAAPQPLAYTPRRRLVDVVACAPGHVVAARLPGRDARAARREVLEAIDNWPGFVLLRHEFRETGAPASEPPRAFYSLYMHLAAPDYDLPPKRGPDGKPRVDVFDGDAYKERVPWFSELYRRRFGAWVRVRPTAAGGAKGSGDEPPADEPIGALYWSAEPVPAAALEACAVHGLTKKLRVRDADGPIYVHKPPPADFLAALAALNDGKVVTFAEPLLPVGAQERVGYLEPLAYELPRADHEPRPPRDRSPFLHWQILAPAGDDNALAKLVELAQELVAPGGGELFHRLDHAGTDNFLDLAAFHDKVGAALDDEERDRHFEPAFAAFRGGEDPDYIDRNPIIELFDRGTTFAPAGWDEPASADPVADEFSYPVELQIESPYLPPVAEHAAARDAGGYPLKLEFWRQEGDEFAPLGGYEVLITQAQLDQQKTSPPEKKFTTLTIRVPAQADKLTITPRVAAVDGRPLEPPATSEVVLFESAVKRRWRNVRLRYPNEWSVDTADTTLKSILDKILSAPEMYGLQSPHVREFAWCDPAKEHIVARIKHGALDGQAIAPAGASASKSLFAGDDMALAPSAELDSLHPVTAVWLLNLLDRDRKIVFLDSFDARPFGSEQRPALAGWIPERDADPHKLLLGQRVTLLVINDDYLYDRRATIPLAIQSASGRGPLPLPEGGYDQSRAGVATRALELDVWGTWSIKAGKHQDGPANPVGAAEISIEPPVLAALTDEESLHEWGATRMEGGRFTFAVKFQPPAPVRLHGYASLKWRKQTASGDWQSAPLQSGELYVRASAEPFVRPRGADVDETQFETEPGGYLVAPRAKTRQPNPTPSFAWRSYVAAYKDIRLACSLAQGLETLRKGGPAFTIAALARDGTSCSIQVAQPTVPRRSKKTARQLLEEAVDDITSRAGAAGLSASPGKSRGALELALAGGPEPVEACEALAAHAASLEFDAARTFVVRAAKTAAGKPRVTDGFSLPTFQSAYDRAKIRLHINLAEGLEVLKKRSGAQLAVEHLSHDGNSCRLSVTPATKLEAVRQTAVSLRFFHGVHVDGKQLALTLAPDSDDFRIVSVDAAPLLAALADELADEDRVHYRFAFTGVSGRDLLTADASRTPEASLTRAQFDALCARTDTVEYVCPSDAGTFEKVSFAPASETSFSLQSSRNTCAIALAVQLRGSLDEWRHYRLKVTRTVDGAQKLDPRAIAVGDRPTLSIACPLPSKPGSVTIKVEAVLASKSEKPEEHPLPAPLVATYEFKPRIDGVELHEDVDGGVLRIAAETHSLVPPVIAPAPGPTVVHRAPAGAENLAHALRVRIEPEGAADADRDPIPADPVHNPGRKRLSQLVQYALKAKGKTPAGYCDERGRFEATIKLALLRGKYKVIVERPGSGELKLPGGKTVKLDPAPAQSYERSGPAE